MLKKIQVDVIEHSKQRYRTLGDWFFEYDKGLEQKLHVRVSETGDWRSNVLIAMHEIVEALLCDFRGIAQAEVDAFDKAHPELDEPGDHPEAPYGDEHCLAMGIERMLAAAMKYPWAEHEKLCEETDDAWPSGSEHQSAVSG